MLIVIDIGNTNITIGIFKDDLLIGNYRLTTKSTRTSDEYGFYLTSFLNTSNVKIEDIEDVIIASVVPNIMYSFNSAIIKYFHKKPIEVSSDTNTGIELLIDHPHTLGVDRIVDAVAAHYIYGGDCLVIDFGTASTFDIVTAEGKFIGGAIAPGIGIMANALTSNTAKLPEISIEKPEHIIAKNTIHAMQSGVVYGYIGLTEKIIHDFEKEFGKPLKVISTGGLGKIIYNQTDMINVHDRDLTFKGLKLIYDLIKKQ